MINKKCTLAASLTSIANQYTINSNDGFVDVDIIGNSRCNDLQSFLPKVLSNEILKESIKRKE